MPDRTDRIELVPAVALVTGGGRRVGKAIATYLAGAGWRIAVHYRTSQVEAQKVADEIVARGTDAAAFGTHLDDESQVAQMVESVFARFGRLDAVVCSAASWLEKPLEETTADDVRQEFAANALGPFLLAKTAGLRMAGQAEGGSVVFVGDWALARPTLDHAAYFVAKGAIPTITRVLARELAERNPNLRVNAVLPGPILSSERAPWSVLEQNRERTLLKRADEPHWLAHAVEFLLTNPWITGVCLPVDAGRTIFAPGESDE